jgi:hypothetical protein
MNKSDSISSLAAALAKAQGAIEGAAKDKMNPHFRSKYADLSSVVDAIKQPLAENGLSYTQVIHDAELAVKVETIIIHSSGEWISNGLCSVPVDKSNAQGYGSALTYARRYSLSAAFGVAPEEDDGNAAAKAAPKDAVLQHVVNAKVTPTAGLLEQLDEETRKRVESIASEVIDCMEVMETATAYDVIEEAKLDVDQKAAMWSLLGSGIRSALKKENEKRKKAELEKLAPTQA